MEQHNQQPHCISLKTLIFAMHLVHLYLKPLLNIGTKKSQITKPKVSIK